MFLFEVYEGFLNCLRWTKENMNNPRIIIGENGFPEEQDIDDSEKKIAYHQVRTLQRFQKSIIKIYIINLTRIIEYVLSILIILKLSLIF
jgi:hypothetical protein